MSDLITAGTTVLADNDHWDGPGPWWPVFPFLWLLIVVAVIFAVSRYGWRRRGYGGTHSGEAKLAERFAAGDIGEQEYRERLAVLREKK